MNSSEENKEVCPKCKGKGRYLDKDDFYHICECGIREREINERRLSFASIPEKYKDVTFDNYDLNLFKGFESAQINKAFKAVKWYFDNFEQMQADGKGLYLYSTCKGSGKTRLALSLANELIDKKKQQVKFATSLDILNEIKNTWNRDTGQNESELLNHLINTNVLVIDDFGTEKARDWVSEKFYQIINGRYTDNKVTIFTSNFDLATIDYDERITDRISEKCYKIPFPNNSVRQMKAKENDDFMKQFV